MSALIVPLSNLSTPYDVSLYEQLVDGAEIAGTTNRFGLPDMVPQGFPRQLPDPLFRKEIYPSCGQLHRQNDANSRARLAWCWEFVGGELNEFNDPRARHISPLREQYTPFTAVVKHTCKSRSPCGLCTGRKS